MADNDPGQQAVLDTPIVARSPIDQPPPVVAIDDWQVSARRSSAPMTLADHTALTKLQVSVPLDVAHGRARHTEHGTLVVGSDPVTWLVLGRRDAVAAHRAALTADRVGEHALVDLTHGRALVRVTGPHVVALMAKLCAADLDERMRPNGSALRTSVASLAVDVIRDDVDGSPSLLLHCERSSGRYLWDVLLDAGGELGLEPTGFHGPLTAVE